MGSALEWFDYSGQTTEELLALEGKYRTDSLVTAFEEAIQQKSLSMPVSEAERYILAVEALEREVNNGGYSQFFFNSSREFAFVIEAALLAIGCPEVADITRTAIHALQLGGPVTAEAALAVIEAGDPATEDALEACDARYYASTEPIAERLFAWIKANQASVRVGTTRIDN